MMPVSHLPTGLLIIGYICFWIELYVFDTGFGRTSCLSTALFGALALFVFWQNRHQPSLWIKNLGTAFREDKIFVGGGLIISGLLCFIILYAAVLPPHLPQEFDALNYHITIPRQHLILGSFAHIPWSSADLFLLPVQFALAPYWLATALPNKIPQLLFLFGLIGVMGRMTESFSQRSVLSKSFIAFSILGAHIVAIQMGTAMLDITLCYLCLAAIDSFMRRNVFLCAVEMSFYFWSKPFIPVQMILVFLLIVIVVGGLKKLRFQILDFNGNSMLNDISEKSIRKAGKQVLKLFVIVSIFIGGPFLLKSSLYAATPLYPFAVGIIPTNSNFINEESLLWQSIKDTAKDHLHRKDQYGEDRSVIGLIKHFWLIAVPEKGVNNRFDYPVGLVYLLCLGPFLWRIVQSITERKVSVFLLFIISFWSVWWIGSHQSRFLMIPIVLVILVIVSDKRFQTKGLQAGILISLILVTISSFRAHRQDFGKWGEEVLRAKDRQMISLSKTVDRSKPVKLNIFDVAYADFVVDVVENNSVFVIQYHE